MIASVIATRRAALLSYEIGILRGPSMPLIPQSRHVPAEVCKETVKFFVSGTTQWPIEVYKMLSS